MYVRTDNKDVNDIKQKYFFLGQKNDKYTNEYIDEYIDV